VQRIVLSWLDPVTEDTEQQTLELPVTIGRAPGNSIVFDSLVVSGQHATLTLEAQGLVLRDHGSRNGTYHNGQRVHGQVLIQPGDSIGVGPFHVVVQLERSDVRLRFDWRDPHTGQQRSVVHRVPVVIGTDPTCQIVVHDPQCAPQHVAVRHEGETLTITDLTQRGSIQVNGQWTARTAINAGAALVVGAYSFVVTVDSAARRRIAGEATIVLGEDDKAAIRAAQEASLAPTAKPGIPPTVAMPATPAIPPTTAIPATPSFPGTPAPVTDPGHVWPPPYFQEVLVPMAAVQQSGLPVVTADYATVGGGLGSFIFADNLVIRGVRQDQIVALGVDAIPYSRYKRLCRNSQIPDRERLRSDSTSTPDNIWGWPGYAAREIWRDVRYGHLGRAASLFWQILGEPTLAQTYTPIAEDVYASIDIEAKRIGWDRIWRYGRVRAIRKTDDGRFIVAFSTSGQGQPSRGFLVAPFLQLATGYPALQFLPDLQKYREETEDFRSVVNAYEDHDHVYEQLESRGGLVVLRGRGIVASRLIQRIYEARKRNPHIGIVQVLRTPITKGHTYGRASREVHNHYELQPFNWPKAAMGGDLRFLLEQSPPEARKKLLTDWGGTTTARRQDWIEIVEGGVRDGWYQIVFGEVERVERTPEGKLATVVRGKGELAGETRYVADFIVDATGLDAKVKTNPLLRDMIDHYQLDLNFLGRLFVDNQFEIPKLRNGNARAFAAGSMTLGGPYAMVDSFIGLNYAALRTTEVLLAAGAPGIRDLSPMRSVAQWFRWMRGTSP